MRSSPRSAPVAAARAATLVAISLAAFAADLRAQITLSEILASNRFTSFDEEGDSSDWIEIHNAGATPVDLEGHALTDDRDVPAKWRFPSLTVPARGHAVVWASGKDVFVPSTEAIESGGLAFVPRWIGLDHTWRYLVAEAGVDGPPTGWHTRTFDDRAWPTGRGGFGYDDGDDRTIVPVDTGAVFTRGSFEVADPAALQSLVMRVDYDDGFVAFLNGRRVAESGAPAAIDFGSTATGKREAGTPEFFDLTPHLGDIVTGMNVLVVVGLNDTPSSDMSLIVELGEVPSLVHTNFELSSDGEELLLFDPQGQLLDAVIFGPQTEDHSYARVAPGDAWRYFLTPTPGEDNAGQSFDEPISDAVSFEPPPGRFGSAVNVELSSSLPDLTEIRFTTDGSLPTPESALFLAPIRVTRTSVIRAAGFIGGERSTRVLSSSYIVNSSNALPILSLSMEPNDFAFVHNTSGARGRSSEREAFMEYILPDGRRAVATGLGLRLHGGAGRGGDFNTKKSYKVYFRGEYGAKKLRYGILPTTEIDVFDKLVLRGAFNDSFRTNGRATLLRDELIRRLHEQMGGVIAHGGWCVLYVNGAFRGVYNIVERMDDEFFSSYFGGKDWDVIKTGDDVLRGDRAEWDAIHSFATSNDLSQPARWEEFTRRVDVPNFTSYMLVNMWAQNHDWPHNNWYTARERVPDGKWLFLCWDAEFGIGLSPSGYAADTLSHVTGGSGRIRDIFVAALRNVSFRAYYRAELERFSTGALGAVNVRAEIERLRAEVEADIPEEMTLFSQSLNDWRNNVTSLLSFAQNRTPVYMRIVADSALGFPEPTGPALSRVTPSTVVNTGDVRLTLTGQRFSPITRVWIGGVEALDVDVESATRIFVTLPFDAGIVGAAEVRILDGGQGIDESYAGLLSVSLPVPRVDSAAPFEGRAAGGEPVVITGDYFLPGARVFFDDEEVPVIRVDSSRQQLELFTPPGAGTVVVRVQNVVPADLLSVTSATFTYRSVGTPFLRGDVNDDGVLDISDPVGTLAALFGGGVAIACARAGDANGSGVVDLSDAVYSLSFLFQGGAAPPVPYPACGLDEASPLDCVAPGSCR